MSRQNVNDDISGAEGSALDYFARHSVIERLLYFPQIDSYLSKFHVYAYGYFYVENSKNYDDYFKSYPVSPKT